MTETEIHRARRRAAHLRVRAGRRPIGSNGRRKDLARAAELEQHAAVAEHALAVERAAAVDLVVAKRLPLIVPEHARA